MRAMITLPVVVGMLWLGGASGVGAQEVMKIGYVDLQRALNECEAGKVAKEKFKTEVEKAEQSLERKKNEVEKLKDELEKKGLLLKEDERDNLEQDYRQKLRDFERAYKDLQQELQIKDRDLTGRILEDLRQVVQALGEQGSYTVILEGNNTVVLYGAGSIDLTESIIKTYNEKGPAKVSKAGGKAQTAN